MRLRGSFVAFKHLRKQQQQQQKRCYRIAQCCSTDPILNTSIRDFRSVAGLELRDLRKQQESIVWGNQRREFLGVGDGDEDSGLSKHHEESRVLGYSPEQMFDVVAGVDFYQDFVPWCQKSVVLWRKDGKLDAELEIGFKFFVERYISHVEFERPNFVKTSVSESNIFEYLNNVWEFTPGPSPGTCHVHFTVSFQFRSPLYRRAANMFFDEVVARLVGSFENRCLLVYGPSAKVVETYAA